MKGDLTILFKMSFLKKCQNPNCKKEQKYTLKENCSSCGKKTNETHYKFIKIKDAPKNSSISQIRKG